MSGIAGYIGDGAGVPVVPSTQSFSNIAQFCGISESDLMAGYIHNIFYNLQKNVILKYQFLIQFCLYL